LKILIKNAQVHQFRDKESFFKLNNIVIDGEEIVYIGNDIDSYDCFDKVIDAENCIVIPGLVNAHLHSHDHFNKGSVDNLPLELYLLYLRPLYSGIKASYDEIYLRTLYGCIEMLKTGTTTIIDDVILSPFLDDKALEAVMRAYETAGMRGYVAGHILNKPIYEAVPYLNDLVDDEVREKINSEFPSEDEILSYIETQINKYNTSKSIIKYAMAPSGPQRCSIELMKGIRRLSEKYNVPAVSHVLESKIQNSTGEILYGKSLIEYLADNDLLYPNFSSIHSVWVSDKDIELLRKNNCKVAHNPGSNLKLGSGIAPTRKFLDKDVTVSLGTDNISANDSINMFEAMKLTGLIHKLNELDFERWIGAQEAFKMATIDGAKSALMDDIVGSLEVNKKADLVILDTDNERFIPSGDYINSLVFAENGSSIKTVMINGKIVVENNKITTFDEREVLQEVKALMPRFEKERKLAKEQAKDLHYSIKEAYFKCVSE